MTFHYEPPKKVEGVVTLTLSEGAYRALYTLVGASSISSNMKRGISHEDAKKLEDLFIKEWEDPSKLEQEEN